LSLFTGDAGQGESNIRRWIIENDWLEAIVALPLNMFYKTGIATYIWVVSSDKPAHRRGKVQLIDATGWFKPLRKNLGQKNCELAEEDIGRICDAFRTFEETGQSKIFPNQAFGYWKVTVERPLRLAMDLTDPNWARFRAMCAEADEELVADLADRLARRLGPGPHTDYNAFMAFVEDDAGRHGLKLTPKRVRLLRDGLARRDENAAPVKTKRGEVEPDPELRDTEQIPLLEPGGIDGFIRREVLPYAPDAWVDPEATKIGYEISFNRYFYKPQPMRSLEEIRADILALERETDGLLGEILGGTS